METESFGAILASVSKILARELKEERVWIPKVRIEKTLELYFSVRPRIQTILFPTLEPLGVQEWPPDSPFGDSTFDRDSIAAILNEVDTYMEFWVELNSHKDYLTTRPRGVFISHGHSQDWRKVQEHIEKHLGIPTVELAQQPNEGRTIVQKLVDEADKCSYAVIVMSGDDTLSNSSDSIEVRARENVVHEIGYFQGKYGPNKVCILHEEGVNIFNNISGIMYIAYPKGYVEVALAKLGIELKNV